MTLAVQPPCPWCGSTRGAVRVHGHGQCADCKTNIEPCCAGDNANDAACNTMGSAVKNTGAQLFPSVFDSIGGPQATVTTDALVFGLCTRLGSDYDQAKALIEVAERIGILLTKPPGVHRLRDVATSAVDPSGHRP